MIILNDILLVNNRPKRLIMIQIFKTKSGIKQIENIIIDL